MDKILVMQTPDDLLRLLSKEKPRIGLEGYEVVDAWALVALSTLARAEKIQLTLNKKSGASRFAHALGLEDVLKGAGQSALGAAESRTVRLRSISQSSEINSTASAIATLLLADVLSSTPSLEDTRKTIEYVLVELLRNALQHGQAVGVVAAQRMDSRNGYSVPTVQVAVADAGIGVPAALELHHPGIADPRVALERALHPHISGTFPAGDSGGIENAGMGLFFVSEFAKRTAGRFLIATRGGALQLVGSESGEPSQIKFLSKGLGFPGTLVGFELRLNEVQDYEALLTHVREAARERTPRRTPQRWLRFEAAPNDAQQMLVKVAAEDTVAAVDYAARVLTPRILKKKPLALDFRGHELFTQSYVHALLYEPVRIAWALRTPIFIINAQPAVRSSLEFLESYALELGSGEPPSGK